jgi:probable rRNA maturation factor
MKVRVDLQFATSANVPTRAKLGRWARAALAGLRRRSATVTLRIVGKKEAQALNSQFRRKHKPTNVLSFPFAPPPGMRSDLLGDVVICADVVRREAREQGKAEHAHWAHMVVHGIMHLRGFDHQNNKEAAVMEAKEIRVLRQLGFSDPYVRP